MHGVVNPPKIERKMILVPLPEYTKRIMNEKCLQRWRRML